MDYEFFESLSIEDAEKYLDNYLRVERDAVSKTLPEIEKDGITADFSIDSVVPVLKWFLKDIKTVKKKREEKLPDWIAVTMDNPDEYEEFDDNSGYLVLRASYYLGECFVRYSKKLEWSTGNIETAEQNMPVVTGFKYDIEMAPMLIIKNLFMRIVVRDAPYTDIDRAIKTWLSSVPD
jgi:hypothetical protein